MGAVATKNMCCFAMNSASRSVISLNVSAMVRRVYSGRRGQELALAHGRRRGDGAVEGERPPQLFRRLVVATGCTQARPAAA